MKFNKVSYIFLALSIVVLGSCVNKATKFFNSGMAKYENEEFDLAAHDLRQAVEYGAPKKESFFAIAESYRLSNRLHEAEQYYFKAIESGCHKDNAYFYHAMAMKSNGNYLGAKSQLQKYLKVGINNELKAKAKREIAAIDKIMEIGFRKDFYQVYNFTEINTDAIDYSPVIYNERTLYFTSSRGEGPIYPGQGTRYKDLFEYKFDGQGKSGIARKLPELINEPKRHESSSTFTPDGMTMIFSRSGNGKRNDYIKEVDLFETKLVQGQWSEPVRLAISDENAWDSCPYLSADGKTLYFSSNREGGFGSNDIWFSIKQEDGTWGTPVNMGEPVNTDGEELFPYIKKNGEFYFSSSGHPGFGELDIFKVVVAPDASKEIINPGKPLNSTHDDFGIIYKDLKTGYFCSNRPGGKGDDDIYYFEYDLQVKYVLEGKTQGYKVLADTVSKILEILPLTAVQLLDDKGNYISSTVSDNKGEFKFDIQPEKIYGLRANRDSYETNQKSFSTIGLKLTDAQIEALKGDVVVKDSIQLRPFVKNMVIEFPPIYYDYDKWDITKSSEYVLEQMVKVMQEHPSILVELGSHTDARGTVLYNDNLSQKRAESAVKYILAKGIAPTRLTAKGYGERIPKILEKDTSGFKKGTELRHTYLDSLEKKDKVKSELGHQLNRRTEFKIVGFIEKAIDVDHIDVIDNGATEELIDTNLIEHEKEIIEKKFGDQKVDVIKEDLNKDEKPINKVEINNSGTVVDPFAE
jgi:peptidoglycan-associated lipoprotein